MNPLPFDAAVDSFTVNECIELLSHHPGDSYTHFKDPLKDIFVGEAVLETISHLLNGKEYLARNIVVLSPLKMSTQDLNGAKTTIRCLNIFSIDGMFWYNNVIITGNYYRVESAEEFRTKLRERVKKFVCKLPPQP
jgi:hypothetical protein